MFGRQPKIDALETDQQTNANEVQNNIPAIVNKYALDQHYDISMLKYAIIETVKWIKPKFTTIENQCS